MEDLRRRRILTVPNVLSFVRLMCVPLFLWLLFGRDERVAAGLLLAVLGATDWVDGYVARHFDQVSELGKVLDPTADRILLGVAVVSLWIDGSVPGVILWPVVVREVAISVAVLAMAAAGAPRVDVLWVGKAGAFALMAAFPLFLLGDAVDGGGVLRVLAWGWAVPGVVLSYVAALQYARLAPGVLRERGRPEEVIR